MNPTTICLMFMISAGATATFEDGVKFRDGSMIKLTFNRGQDFNPTPVEEVRVAFNTLYKKGILLQYRDDTNKYVSLRMNNNGGIKLSMDIGSDRWEWNTPSSIPVDFANGQDHEVVLTLSPSSQSMAMKSVALQGMVGTKDPNSVKAVAMVDEHPHVTAIYPGQNINKFLASAPYVFIGNNGTGIRFGDGQFEGCVRSMQMDDFDLLRTAFLSPPPPCIDVHLVAGTGIDVFEGCEPSAQSSSDSTTGSSHLDCEPTYCPPGFELHESMCFRYINSEQTWIDAAAYCRVMNARLVSVDDEDENSFVKTFVARNMAESDTMVWTDLTNIQGEFMWLAHNRSVSYTSWAPGQPGVDRHDISCVVDDGGLWYAIPCGRSRKFVCEIEFDDDVDDVSDEG